jgi:creatinine amidohydrolase
MYFPGKELGSIRVDGLTWPKFAEIREKTDKAIIPAGTLEAHGRHGPLGFDTFIAEAIADNLSKETGALIFPTVPYGCCALVYDSSLWPGTISIEPRILIDLYAEIGKEIARQGMRTILFVNGHMPNSSILEMAGFDIWKTTGVAVGVLEWWSAAQEEIRAEKGQTHGTHGDEIETSLVLASAKADSVDLRDAVANQDHPLISDEEMRLYLAHGKFTRAMDKRWVGDSANHGNPNLASEEIGRRIISRASEVGKDMFAALDRNVNEELLAQWRSRGGYPQKG